MAWLDCQKTVPRDRKASWKPVVDKGNRTSVCEKDAAHLASKGLMGVRCWSIAHTWVVNELPRSKGVLCAGDKRRIGTPTRAAAREEEVRSRRVKGTGTLSPLALQNARAFPLDAIQTGRYPPHMKSAVTFGRGNEIELAASLPQREVARVLATRAEAPLYPEWPLGALGNGKLRLLITRVVYVHPEEGTAVF